MTRSRSFKRLPHISSFFQCSLHKLSVLVAVFSNSGIVFGYYKNQGISFTTTSKRGGQQKHQSLKHPAFIQKNTVLLLLSSMDNKIKSNSSNKDSRISSMSQSANSASSSSCFEVEEKFSLMDKDLNNIHKRLVELGYQLADETIMTDWYFDTKDYELVQQDCWLRYRVKELQQDGNDRIKKYLSSKDKGLWQLKIGKNDNAKVQESKASVYEEVEGNEAFFIALDRLSNQNRDKVSLALGLDDHNRIMDYKDYNIPDFPPINDNNNNVDLIPFARIYTHRSTWKATLPNYANLIVDLDTTDFGHAVGEVETIVSNNQTEIAMARKRISDFLSLLLQSSEFSDKTNALPAMGKLEYYIQQNRRKVYKLLVEKGLL